ncbi:hypothetical protein QOW_1463 [Clostridioides difficile Y215]|nr:hypothetical protein QKO_1589 [Clostridioides difficile DA00195]EQI35283.1 hypothetical protein QOW_1463 [Clostridioides difficile Y215]
MELNEMLKANGKKSGNILDKMFEKYSVILPGIITIIMCIKIFPNVLNIIKIDVLLSSLTTITVTLIGILITALTILVAIINTKTVKILCKNKLWNKFINYFITPIILGIILLVYLIYIMCILKNEIVFKFDITIVLALLIMFLSGIIRIGYMLIVIIKVTPEVDETKEHSIKKIENINLKEKLNNKK